MENKKKASTTNEYFSIPENILEFNLYGTPAEIQMIVIKGFQNVTHLSPRKITIHLSKMLYKIDKDAIILSLAKLINLTHIDFNGSIVDQEFMRVFGTSSNLVSLALSYSDYNINRSLASGLLMNNKYLREILLETNHLWFFQRLS